MKKLLTTLCTLIGCTTATEPERIATLTIDNRTGYTAFVITENGYVHTAHRHAVTTQTISVPQVVHVYCNGEVLTDTVRGAMVYTVE